MKPPAPRPPRRPPVTLLDAMADPRLFGAHVSGPTWESWRVFLAALFALPMTPPQLALYRAHTGQQSSPSDPPREAWVICGRRSGKSRISALVAVYLACFRDYRAHLAPGEKGTVMLLAADRRQARVLMRYCLGMIEGVPMLAQLVVNRTAESVELSNRVVIEIHTSNFRAIRGYSVIAAVCDEIAFWRSEESANPDVEILNALRPAMSTVPGALLVCPSTPYARRGALWQAYRDHYGKRGDPVLVWQASSDAMNPTIDRRVIAEAYEQDEAAASAEYGAEFRRDIESYVTREAVEAATVLGRCELPPVSGCPYLAFVDPSGGAQDSMTLALAHPEERDGHAVAVLDLIAERRPPFSPEAVVDDFAAVLKRYDVPAVVGDRYGGDWPREQFRKRAIEYLLAEWAKSEIYRELLPALNSGRVELLDDPRLAAQLLGLERRTARGGRDSIDHAPGAHDDLINAAAGVLLLAASVGAAGPVEYDGQPGIPEDEITGNWLDQDDRVRDFLAGW